MSETNVSIVARADRTYRIRRLIFVLAFFGMGAYFLYDGFVGYPRKNAEIDRLTEEREKANTDFRYKDRDEIIVQLDKLGKKKEDFDIMLQRLLGFALFPVGLGLHAFFVYRSRGEYRLENTKLSAPGHPTIDLSEIESVDYSQWKKKGLAWIDYKHGEETGTIVLDDDKYDRPKIDAIYDVIAQSMGIGEQETKGETPEKPA